MQGGLTDKELDFCEKMQTGPVTLAGELAYVFASHQPHGTPVEPEPEDYYDAVRQLDRSRAKEEEDNSKGSLQAVADYEQEKFLEDVRLANN